MARDNIPGYASIHQPEFANDGFYGNGASWISDSSNSWLKIDLGRIVLVDRVTLGRDRNGGFNDRDSGQFTIDVALTDNIYANGDDSNDSNEYSQVFDSPSVGFSGIISGAQTLEASFSNVYARFVKLTATNGGTAIDELEVFGSLLNIDIKPGSSTNPIDPRSKGVIPVGILGGASLDVDVSTVTFGPDGASPAHDGHIEGDDLILHFRTQQTGIQKGDTQACLGGQTTGGTAIEGCDDIRTVGK